MKRNHRRIFPKPLKEEKAVSEPTFQATRTAPRRRAARALVAGALAALCLVSSPPLLAADGSGQVNLILNTLKRARVIDLSHTWDKFSPIASVNPPYSFALAATHQNTI